VKASNLTSRIHDPKEMWTEYTTCLSGMSITALKFRLDGQSSRTCKREPDWAVELNKWLRLLKTVSKKWYVVRFDVFTAVTMRNGVFWDVTPCGSCTNRRFGGNLAPPSSG
jgi:hypothetical protein